MRLSSRNLLLVVIAAFVIVAVLVFFLLVFPKFGILTGLDGQIVQAQQDVDAAKALLEQRLASKNRSADTEATWLRLTNMLPESPELPALIIELQDTANDAGVEFVSLTPEAIAAQTGYSAVPLNATITGRWSDVIDYFARLNRLTRQVRIASFGFAPYVAVTDTEATTSTTPETQVTATVRLEAYTLAPPGAAGASAPAAP